MAKVVLEKVKKEYDNGFVAVHGADIEIRDGEFVVLVGPSGCGKSTTLRMIAGLESITEGKLYIADRLVNDVPPKDRDIAMVFQNYALYPHMTVFDNMAFGLKLRKYSKQEIKERVENAARILSIESILDRKPKQLSGGQRQRVAVGRAIVRKPKVFLFDEPLSNLDAKLRVQMRTEISKLHRQLQSTMVYVTHDQVEAMTMGDRIVVLKDGYIQQVDTPLNLYDHPKNKFVAGFIGSPAMNFIEGSIAVNGSVDFVSNGGEVRIPVNSKRSDVMRSHAGKSVTIGIRPEDVYVSSHTPKDLPVASIASLTLDVVEPMGNEIFIYTTGNDGSIVGRIAPQSLPSVGETVTLDVDLDKVHFFDGESEATLAEEG